MIILPAIDIYKGECVRLTEGAFETTEKVADDWLKTAKSFEEAGASWVHMVDLDGALMGRPINSRIFIGVADKTGLKVELGGGIRTMEDIEYYLKNGISRIILGSVAVNDPSFVKEAVDKYGSKVAVGIDAKDGFVKTSGWTKGSEFNYIEIAKQMESFGVEVIIYTDISKDGTLMGPNLEHLKKLDETVSSKIIASGGIRNLDDLKSLRKLNLYGAICGKSIYQGSLNLKEAIRL
ncbi:MAG TPA: 1-(5-phosphoribosyl)-5-[(5-phosphoribosylamino)methylideneamino]imidazole-4-carboxamide isomerase [Anaerovoracaceae bacterium]|nr:1-(5-phosphoribosyl)-5-[(5-phosphoribosylamino)methylideneamino]imidazole-4-carboxamide isomerase [Anaerovoracaceae bacterium]